MKIIALSCSPSRGRNSDTMLDSFILGMKEIPDIEVEKIYLDDIPIDLYTYKNSKAPTSHETEFKELARKITQDINGLVIATPTYNFSVPAHLKNFIDRIRFFALDFTQKSKLGQPVGTLEHLQTYFLVSGGTPRWAEKLLFFAFPSFWLRGVFLYFNAKVMGALYTGDIKGYENEKLLKQCRHNGHVYARKVKERRTHGLLERIFFRPPQIR